MAKKIMIVDDELHMVRYLESIFQDNGYETCAASNGKQAMDVLESEKPDLITLDLQMPHMRGTKFYMSIRKDEAFNEIPVVVISGLAAPYKAIPKAVAALSKPFDVDELLEVVKKNVG